jgi:hypothetical protein
MRLPSILPLAIAQMDSTSMNLLLHIICTLKTLTMEVLLLLQLVSCRRLKHVVQARTEQLQASMVGACCSAAPRSASTAAKARAALVAEPCSACSADYYSVYAVPRDDCRSA